MTSHGHQREDTRERILETAAKLFATRGVDKTFMRDLTKAAGVNLASVNYHFRSKDGLIEELYDRLAGEVSEWRARELEALLATANSAGMPPRLEDIVNCFVRPYIDQSLIPRSELLPQLILQHRIAPTEITDRVHKRHFDPMAQRFIFALSMAVPGIPTVQWYWRYTFMVSTVVMTVADMSSGERLFALSKGKANTTDRTELWRYLVQHLCAALSTAALTETEGSGGGQA